MKLANTVFTGIIFILALSACHRGMICPAFQSSFIMDDSVRTAIFSPFKDSLPKEFMVDKSKYGIINELTYAEKNNSIKNIHMQLVFPPGLPAAEDTSALFALPPSPDSLEYQLTKKK